MNVNRVDLRHSFEQLGACNHVKFMHVQSIWFYLL